MGNLPNLSSFTNALIKSWDEIPLTYVDRLMGNVVRKMKIVITAICESKRYQFTHYQSSYSTLLFVFSFNVNLVIIIRMSAVAISTRIKRFGGNIYLAPCVYWTLIISRVMGLAMLKRLRHLPPKLVRVSNPRSPGLFGSGWRVAVAVLVTTPDLARPCWVLYHSKSQLRSCWLLFRIYRCSGSYWPTGMVLILYSYIIKALSVPLIQSPSMKFRRATN